MLIVSHNQSGNFTIAVLTNAKKRTAFESRRSLTRKESGGFIQGGFENETAEELGLDMSMEVDGFFGLMYDAVFDWPGGLFKVDNGYKLHRHFQDVYFDIAHAMQSHAMQC